MLARMYITGKKDGSSTHGRNMQTWRAALATVASSDFSSSNETFVSPVDMCLVEEVRKEGESRKGCK